MNIIIKQAAHGDILSINAIMFQSLAHWGYTLDELNKIMDLYKIDDEYFSKNIIYLAYSDDVLLGFFSFIKNKNDEDELYYFFIQEDMIGIGHGSNMWKLCCKKAKSLGMDTFVIMSVPDAEGFYLKMGAVRTGSHPSIIREGVFLPLLKFDLTA